MRKLDSWCSALGRESLLSRMTVELPLSAMRIGILRLVHREWRAERSEELRFGC